MISVWSIFPLCPSPLTPSRQTVPRSGSSNRQTKNPAWCMRCCTRVPRRWLSTIRQLGKRGPACGGEVNFGADREMTSPSLHLLLVLCAISRWVRDFSSEQRATYRSRSSSQQLRHGQASTKQFDAQSKNRNGNQLFEISSHSLNKIHTFVF